MSDTERERVAANVALIKCHMPELVPVIQDLHAHGLIEGWRNVRKVELLREA